MSRNEHFDASHADTLAIKLAWASLELLSADIPDIQVVISGPDSDAADMKLNLSDGKLTVEQPNYGLSPRINEGHWMQVVVRIPQWWKGAASVYTTTGTLNARGLTGTDILLDTLTGDLKAADIHAFDLSLKTVSGRVQGEGLQGDKLSIRSVTGGVDLFRSAFRELKLNAVSGDMSLQTGPFASLDVTTVSGDVSVVSPVSTADLNFRSVSGRLRTDGVNLSAGAPHVGVSSVSGSFEITAKAD